MGIVINNVNDIKENSFTYINQLNLIKNFDFIQIAAPRESPLDMT